MAKIKVGGQTFNWHENKKDESWHPTGPITTDQTGQYQLRSDTGEKSYIPNLSLARGKDYDTALSQIPKDSHWDSAKGKYVANSHALENLTMGLALGPFMALAAPALGLQGATGLVGQAAQAAGRGAITSGASAALQGRNPLRPALMGAAGGGAGSLASEATGSLLPTDLSPTLRNTVTGAAGGGASAAATGNNPLRGAAGGAFGGATSRLRPQQRIGANVGRDLVMGRGGLSSRLRGAGLNAAGSELNEVLPSEGGFLQQTGTDYIKDQAMSQLNRRLPRPRATRRRPR